MNPEPGTRNSKLPWDWQQDRTLKKLADKGVSVELIASRLRRTPKAVAKRLARLRPGNGRNWPPEAVRECERLRRAEYSIAQIAARLGCTGEAVLYHLERLRTPRPAVLRRRTAPAAAHHTRPCLCCRAPFPSAGPHNRLCDTCRQKSPEPFAP